MVLALAGQEDAGESYSYLLLKLPNVGVLFLQHLLVSLTVSFGLRDFSLLLVIVCLCRGSAQPIHFEGARRRGSSCWSKRFP